MLLTRWWRRQTYNEVSSVVGWGVMAGRRTEGNRYVSWLNWVGIDVLTGKAEPSLTFLPRSSKCILSGAGESRLPSLPACLLAEAACEGFQGKWEENVTSCHGKKCSGTDGTLWLPLTSYAGSGCFAPIWGKLSRMHTFIHSFNSLWTFSMWIPD